MKNWYSLNGQSIELLDRIHRHLITYLRSGKTVSDHHDLIMRDAKPTMDNVTLTLFEEPIDGYHDMRRVKKGRIYKETILIDTDKENLPLPKTDEEALEVVNKIINDGWREPVGK